MTINALLLVPIFLVAVVDWIAVWRGSSRLELIFKPAVLVLLLVWFSLSTGWQDHLFWFGLALFFSLIGDVLLMFENYFLAGLVSFLLAHIFYTIGFNPTPIPLTPLSIGLTVVIWMGGMLLFRRLIAAIREREEYALMQYPILLYSLAVSILLLSAVSTLARPEWPFLAAALAAVGGLFFFLSDGLLAYDRFVTHLSHGKFWVHLLYHLGQIALIAGILIRYGRM